MERRTGRVDPTVEDIIRRARAHLPVSQPTRPLERRHHQQPPGSGFWWLWTLGTVVPAILAYILCRNGAGGDGRLWVVLLAIGCSALNVLFALGTGGYIDESEATGFGRGLALTTGWIVLLIGGAVILFVLLVSWGVITVLGSHTDG